MLPSIWAGSLPAGFSFFFPALDSGCCPASGRGASSFFFLSCAGWRLLPGIRAGSPPGEGQGVKGDCFLLFRRWIADVAQHLGWVASRRGAGGRGLRRPLPPTTPYPALEAAILDGQQGDAGRTIGPLPAARQRAFVLPLSREDAGRASVRRRSFRPCRGGDLLRALPRSRQQAESLFPLRKRYVIP